MGLTFNLGRDSAALTSDASLNVGIGGSPSGSYKLEVTGTAKVSSTLLLGGALSGTSATFSSSVVTGGGTIDGSTPQLQSGGTIMSTGSSLIAAPTTASVVLDYQSANNTGRLMAGSGGAWNKNISINPYGGNVGIGTTTINEKLVVVGNSSADGFIFIGGGAGTTLGGLKFGNQTNTYGQLSFDNVSNDVPFSAYRIKVLDSSRPSQAIGSYYGGSAGYVWQLNRV